MRARNLGVPILLEEGKSYLKAKSTIDTGIVIGRYSRMSERKIIDSIRYGKSFNPTQSISKVDQQNAFIKVWGEALA